ncbi:MAG: S8 family peptidase [Planctomycetaceae bacterium]|jgi:subtilisin family serine protease|nr:S8 family peptidase [Planctomycetaceae bacterium]
MKNKILRSHFIIPESDIKNIKNNPTGRTKIVPRDYNDHGQKLISSLERIKKQFSKTKPLSLGDDSIVFRIKLHEGHKFQEQAKQDFLKRYNLEVKVVQTNELAIVAASPKPLENFNRIITEYRDSGINKTNLNYIDDILTYKGFDKNSNALQKLLEDPKNENPLDVQLMLFPNYTREQYQQALHQIKEHIEAVGGKLKREPFFLSNGIPIIRAELTAYQLSTVAENSAIYLVEETGFFRFDPSGVRSESLQKLSLDPEININSLESVVIIDSGIDFSNTPVLEQLVVDHWLPQGYRTLDTSHGTYVASRVILGENIEQQIRLGVLTPQATVIDACVLVENNLSEDQLILYLKDIVETYHKKAKIYNLSLNTAKSIQADRIGVAAYEIDNLMRQYGVIFVISSGNHNVWQNHNSIEDFLDDDDIQIAPPAESYFALTVGAINDKNDPDSITQTNELSPYSRIGLGFACCEKPELVAYGGNISKVNGSLFGTGVISNNGKYKCVSGTSYSAPIVSNHLSVLLSVLPLENNVMIAKTLLIHLAEPMYNYEQLQEDEIALQKKLYGNGMSSIERSLNSTPQRVTFVATNQMNRLTKQRVAFRVPETLANISGIKSPAVVTVTSMIFPPLDYTKGTEYLGAYVSASLHKIDGQGNSVVSNPTGDRGRQKWQSIYHFKKSFCRFNPGDWEVWLELFTRWDTDTTENIPYVLAITIETPSEQADIYTAIQQEVPHKYRLLTAAVTDVTI